MTRYPAECPAFEYQGEVFEGRLYWRNPKDGFSHEYMTLIDSRAPWVGSAVAYSLSVDLKHFKPLTRAAYEMYEHVRLSYQEKYPCDPSCSTTSL